MFNFKLPLYVPEPRSGCEQSQFGNLYCGEQREMRCLIVDAAMNASQLFLLQDHILQLTYVKKLQVNIDLLPNAS